MPFNGDLRDPNPKELIGVPREVIELAEEKFREGYFTVTSETPKKKKPDAEKRLKDLEKRVTNLEARPFEVRY